MHRERERQDREADHQQCLLGNAPAGCSLVCASRLGPRAERVIPGAQALNQRLLRPDAGTGIRKLGAMPRFEPAQPIERVHDRIGLCARHFRVGLGSSRAQRHPGGDSFDFEVGASSAQRLQSLLVTAKLRELRLVARETVRFRAPVVFAAHRFADSRNAPVLQRASGTPCPEGSPRKFRSRAPGPDPQSSTSTPTGQWSEPVSCGQMNASRTRRIAPGEAIT